MPAVSDAQRRFMFGVLSGKIKGTGLTKKQASEFAHTPGKLPERKKAKGGKG